MIRINLIRGEGQRPKRSLMPTTGRVEQVGLGLFALGAIVIGGWYWMLDGQREAAKSEMGLLQQRLVEMKVMQAQIDQYQQQRLQLDERIQTIENLTARREGPVDLMNQVLAAVPAEPRLWLTLLDQQRGGLKVEGRAFDVPALADFIASLGRQPRIQHVELGHWEEIGDLVVFELHCQLRAPQPSGATAGADLALGADPAADTGQPVDSTHSAGGD